MRQAFLILNSILLLLACNNEPLELLNNAKDKINDSGLISYKQVALWPNPVGKVDTLKLSSFFYKNENAYSNYDFIGLRDKSATIYINKSFQKINHKDSMVLVYPKEKEEPFIKENIILMFSPITIINKPSWRYAKDTIMQGRKYREYERIEMDTIMDGHKVYVENSIFINTSSALLERFERRSFFNGEKGQKIVHHFLEYKLNHEGEPLAYKFPEKYKTRIFQDRWKSPLTKGQEAPLFNAKDIQGNQINLKDLQGKKVLLNFSVINCAYCKIALEHFNREDYQISDKVFGIYINPMDRKSDVLDYAGKVSIPFPVIAGVKGMDDLYGISVYPTFILIDEQGRVEKVINGYRKEFLESIKM